METTGKQEHSYFFQNKLLIYAVQIDADLTDSKITFFKAKKFSLSSV
jgi:hypothetical protein